MLYLPKSKLPFLGDWQSVSVGDNEADHRRSDVVSAEAQQATYQALMEFVRTEWIEGPCEGGQPCEPLLPHTFMRAYGAEGLTMDLQSCETNYRQH